jgi:DNA-binding HxlR family transcriptional regulator
MESLSRNTVIKESPTHDRNVCIKELRSISDTLYVIGGQWKLSIVFSLSFGKNARFSELQRDLTPISPRVLSKELKELELNLIVEKVDLISNVNGSTRSHKGYTLTEHGESLKPMLKVMKEWGEYHRDKLLKND